MYLLQKPKRPKVRIYALKIPFTFFMGEISAAKSTLIMYLVLSSKFGFQREYATACLFG